MGDIVTAGSSGQRGGGCRRNGQNDPWRCHQDVTELRVAALSVVCLVPETRETSKTTQKKQEKCSSALLLRNEPHAKATKRSRIDTARGKSEIYSSRTQQWTMDNARPGDHKGQLKDSTTDNWETHRRQLNSSTEN
mmetsp:Transcript_28557/g.60869  ORF Transcript_28557/g.60869 Transcript_28557/m.60869 type:complete len:136 (+) Transcript_28557:1020-1427(+)